MRSARKFRGCAEFGRWPAAHTTRIIETVRRLEELPDVRSLTALLAGND